MDKMRQRVLNHLNENHTLTRMQAIDLWGCTELAHYIWELRNIDGIDVKKRTIKGKNRWGENTSFAEYYI